MHTVEDMYSFPIYNLNNWITVIESLSPLPDRIVENACMSGQKVLLVNFGVPS